MFDIIGFWVAATIFCLPPALFSLVALLKVIRSMVRKESNNELDLELYHKVRRIFGTDIVVVFFTSLLLSMPMCSVAFSYLVDPRIELAGLTFLQWLAHCCEWWATVGGFLATIGAVVAVLMLLTKGYVKLTILSERVKKL